MSAPADNAESDEQLYECRAEDCSRTFDSKQGRGCHEGTSHDIEQFLLEALEELTAELGRTPKVKDMDEYGAYSGATYRKNFGSWNNALEEAGLELNHDPSTNVTSEKLLEELEELAAELGRTPKIRDMNEYGAYSSNTYKKNFGSWNGALEEVGLELNRDTSTNVTSEKLLEELEELAAELGRTPKIRDMNEYGTYSSTTYRRHFGSWNGALEEAGLEPNQRHDVSTKVLLEALEELATDLGRTPTMQDMDEYGAYSGPTYRKHFGSWNDALEEAGLELNQEQSTNVTKEKLLEELKELATDLGRTPTMQDMDEYGAYSRHTYPRYFGSWNNALKEAGLELNVVYGIRDPTTDYGPGWHTIAESVRSRDDRTCRICGVESAEYEKKLHVHHITPRREFLEEEDPDYDAMNDPSNLVTLCPSCHRTFEGRFTDCCHQSFVQQAKRELYSQHTGDAPAGLQAFA